MWDTVFPKSNCSWEPVELRILKQELAHMACKCNTCESFRHPSLYNRGLAQFNDEAVQVDQKNVLLNKYIYADTDGTDKLQQIAATIPAGIDELQQNSTPYLHKEAFCPNCYFIWDLLRRAKKVFKDVESETKPESTDKSTEKTVKFVDSSTSVTNKPVLKPMSSNLTLCDFLSDCSSDSSAHSRKRSHHEKVTFLEDFPHVDANKVKPSITMHGNCFCLENFMDSIRPPLNSVL